MLGNLWWRLSAAAHGSVCLEPSSDLSQTAVAAAVVDDDALALSGEEEHLGVPVLGTKRPSVVEHDWLGVLGKRSVLPGGRYPTKHVAGDRHVADGWERQVSGHQRRAGRRQLPQETDPDAGRLLGVVFEAVVPIGMFEPDREHGVAGEHQ